MSFSSDISERLQMARKNAGYKSARAFAHANNIPYITYSQHESGARKLSTNTLVKYSEILDISPGWLLTGMNEYSSPVVENSNNLLENFSFNIEQRVPQKIDANFLGDVFEETNKILNELNIEMCDKDKINLAIELCNALSSGEISLAVKKNNLKSLLETIRKLKLKMNNVA